MGELGWHVGVVVHGHGDATAPQDLHRDPWLNVKRSQQFRFLFPAPDYESIHLLLALAALVAFPYMELVCDPTHDVAKADRSLRRNFLHDAGR